MLPTWARLLLSPALLALLTLAACTSGGSPEAPDPSPGDETAWPGTPEQLMANLVAAYEDMDYAAYEACLHPDFRFVFPDGDVWSRAQDLSSAEHLFAGDAGSNGMSVSSVIIRTLEQAGTWTETDSTHVYFPDTRQGVFAAVLIFRLDSGTHTITVDAAQHFFLVSGMADPGDGTPITRWYLAGQQDFDPWRSSDTPATWGDVKALYS